MFGPYSFGQLIFGEILDETTTVPRKKFTGYRPRYTGGKENQLDFWKKGIKKAHFNRNLIEQSIISMFYLR